MAHGDRVAKGPAGIRIGLDNGNGLAAFLHQVIAHRHAAATFSFGRERYGGDGVVALDDVEPLVAEDAERRSNRRSSCDRSADTTDRPAATMAERTVELYDGLLAATLAELAGGPAALIARAVVAVEAGDFRQESRARALWTLRAATAHLHHYDGKGAAELLTTTTRPSSAS